MAESTGAQLEILDGRDYNATFSVEPTLPVKRNAWTRVSPFVVPEREFLFRIGAIVSRSADRKTVAVVAVNRSLFPETLVILQDGVESASAEMLTGPSPAADNETSPETEKVLQTEAEVMTGKVRLLIPTLHCGSPAAFEVILSAISRIGCCWCGMACSDRRPS
ncbi:MAG: hypothetical protein HPZ91_16275 [Lentisphaeria bacterium]|nr:hypothetical protein [Lentisphaeria bacterium]